MFGHHARLTSVLGAVTAGALLVVAPASAGETVQPVPVQLPPILPCATQWTNVIVGTEQDDRILGTDGNDLILGLEGDDIVYGGAGADTILGGDGADVLAGGPGDDCIVGGLGADHSVLWLFSMPNGNDDSHSVAFRYEY